MNRFKTRLSRNYRAGVDIDVNTRLKKGVTALTLVLKYDERESTPFLTPQSGLEYIRFSVRGVSDTS